MSTVTILNSLIKAAKEEIAKDITPAAKLAILEEIRVFIQHDLPGIWGIIAGLIIDGLEATINISATSISVVTNAPPAAAGVEKSSVTVIPTSVGAATMPNSGFVYTT